MSEEGVVMD